MTCAGGVELAPVRPVGGAGGMKSPLGRPPLSASQSTAPEVVSAIACWNAGYDAFWVMSAKSAPDCQPTRIGSSARRKLKNAPT